jgi:hypothetical protein
MSMQELRLVSEGPQLPTARDFLTSAGFGGAAALVAAIILVLIAIFALRKASQRHQLRLEQQEHHLQEIREDELRAAAVTRCWQRFVWVVETAGLEPAASENATLGLGPELALELLSGLLRDAEKLGDDTLTKSVAVYLNQLSLVLAQQSGPLSGLAAAGSAPPRAKVDERARPPAPKPPPPPAKAAEPRNVPEPRKAPEPRKDVPETTSRATPEAAAAKATQEATQQAPVPAATQQASQAAPAAKGPRRRG